MNSDFLVYVQKLELMAFFSGYPIIYTVTLFFSNERKVINRIFSLLPLSYALIGTLFLGFQLKNLYPDYSIEHIKLLIQPPYLLVIWGLLSIFFWIPALAKRAALSLIHSLVFFFFLASDLFLQLTSSVDDNIIKNDMNVYATSLLLSLGAIAFLILLSFPFDYYKKHLAFSKKMTTPL